MKKIFSKHLYKEALRQGLAIGIIFTALFLLVSVIKFVDVFNRIELFNFYNSTSSSITVKENNFNQSYFLSFYVLAPLLVFQLFGFLTKRSHSDFYHSVPYTRVCLYLSNFAGILTWILIAVVIPAIVCLPAYYILASTTHFLYIDLPGVLLLLFNTFAASMITSGIAAIALSITGMYFPALMISALILFLPKILIYFMTNQIRVLLPFMTQYSFETLDFLQYSIPSSILNWFFPFAKNISWYTSIESGIYSFCAGIFYIGLGCLLFKRRRSEIAGQSAPNKVLQYLYCTAVGLAVSTIPLGLLFSDGISLLVVFLYGITVLICLAYEFITTHKLQSFKKALVSVAAVAILNVMISVIIFGSCRILQSQEIEVAGFRTNEQLIELRDKTPTEEELLIKDIVIDDPALCQMVEDALNRTRTNGKNIDIKSVDIRTSTIQIVAPNGKRYYRNIIFTQKEFYLLDKYWENNGTYNQNIYEEIIGNK